MVGKYSLLSIFSDLISKYEQEHYFIEPVEPKDVLCSLMEACGFKARGTNGDLSNCC